MAGNQKLRSELTRLTIPPPGAGSEWLDAQIIEIEELRKRYQHTIRLHTQCSPDIGEMNCFMHALGIAPEAVRDMCLGPIFPGKQFVQFLLNAHLRESQALTSNHFAIYFRAGLPEHAGIWTDQTVISKWGSGGTHIWQHGLWEVPDTYGDDARIFAPLPEATALYRQWAANHGI